eukprot:gene10386-2518_t
MSPLPDACYEYFRYFSQHDAISAGFVRECLGCLGIDATAEQNVEACNFSGSGPTTCGDSGSPKDIMDACEAKLITKLGYTIEEYVSSLPPRVVLNRMERFGYKVVASAGMGQTCSWTLYKQD